ncbi:hypothetical protein PENSPDRAFT_484766 [Peniophora sp. CONT]|nr:hypothetical protein PENSPDRAFT_484766 [Peniophora sp. CONT]
MPSVEPRLDDGMWSRRHGDDHVPMRCSASSGNARHCRSGSTCHCMADKAFDRSSEASPDELESPEVFRSSTVLEGLAEEGFFLQALSAATSNYTAHGGCMAGISGSQFCSLQPQRARTGLRGLGSLRVVALDVLCTVCGVRLERWSCKAIRPKNHSSYLRGAHQLSKRWTRRYQ